MTTSYEISVKGKLRIGSIDTRTYHVDKIDVPITKRAAKAIAQIDFSEIEEINVDEVTVTKHPIDLVEDNDNASE